MKRILFLIGVVAMGLEVAGCAGNLEAIAKASLNSRQDVFQQIQSVQPVNGKALLNAVFLTTTS